VLSCQGRLTETGHERLRDKGLGFGMGEADLQEVMAILVIQHHTLGESINLEYQVDSSPPRQHHCCIDLSGSSTLWASGSQSSMTAIVSLGKRPKHTSYPLDDT